MSALGQRVFDLSCDHELAMLVMMDGFGDISATRRLLEGAVLL
jgi:hypothetical protein